MLFSANVFDDSADSIMRSGTGRILTLGGLPGTGTTTACRRLSAELYIPHVYAGARFRELAVEAGMTLEEFNAFAELNGQVDMDLDAWQVHLLTQGQPMVLEGRLSGFLAHRKGVPALKVWLTCSQDVRARRLMARDGGNLSDVIEQMRTREESEHKRYLSIYGWNSHDLSVHDLIVDTTHLTEHEVVETILKK